MKKAIAVTLTLALALVLSLVAIPAQAAAEDEIEKAIEKGKAWLVLQQNSDGSWGSYAQVARTGFAVVKLEEQAWELGLDPIDPAYQYSKNVVDGLNYIFSQAGKSDCCDEGIVFGPDWQWTYNTGIAMMAIAASRAPDRTVNVGNPVVDGKTYKEVVQANVDYFECAQNPDGGWQYKCLNQPSDNSNTGYAVLGLIYAQAKPFECYVSQDLKDNLSGWIDYIQNDVDVDANDGGSGYSDPNQWVNLLKTGNLLTEMALVTDTLDEQRVQDAIDYIERHWNDPDPGYMPGESGWKGPLPPYTSPHYQAMYCLMKGLAIYAIETITVDSTEVNWYDEMAKAIVQTQQADGSWPGQYWGDAILSTEWALLTLEVVILDIVLPEVWCVESVNPHGKNVPPAGKTTLPGAKGGQNEDGFYQLFAEDNRDEEPEIYVNGFGPFASGTVVKVTQAPGAAPSCKKIGSTQGQAGAVLWHITLPTDPCVTAVDDSGNVSECTQCLVPPPPK